MKEKRDWIDRANKVLRDKHRVARDIGLDTKRMKPLIEYYDFNKLHEDLCKAIELPRSMSFIHEASFDKKGAFIQYWELVLSVAATEEVVFIDSTNHRNESEEWYGFWIKSEAEDIDIPLNLDQERLSNYGF